MVVVKRVWKVEQYYASRSRFFFFPSPTLPLFALVLFLTFLLALPFFLSFLFHPGSPLNPLNFENNYEERSIAL